MDYPHHDGAQMGLLKPDLAAYGNGTSTTCPGTGYCSFSGTSSATPHVAGIVALMLQANPDATPAELAEALMTTAQHRGTPGKNLDYGTGLVQAYPAVLAVESGVVYHGARLRRRRPRQRRSAGSTRASRSCCPSRSRAGPTRRSTGSRRS